MSIVIVNFKAYKKSYGKQALALAEICKERDAWVCVSATELSQVAATGVRTLAQHVDGVSEGKHTGAILPEAVKAAGAFGTILNHSEKRLSRDELESAVRRCKEVGLYTVVCAESVEEAQSFLGLEADMLAVEIPELIGGDVSITSARPGIVAEAVDALGSNVLLGAGVSSAEDLQTALSEGAAGVLLASAIVDKAEDPKAALEALYHA